MTATCRKYVRSTRAVVRLNLIQALSATLAGRPRLVAHHRAVAASCRRDARDMQLTSAHCSLITAH